MLPMEILGREMPEKKKEKKEFKREIKPSKGKEVMVVTTKPAKISGKKKVRLIHPNTKGRPKCL